LEEAPALSLFPSLPARPPNIKRISHREPLQRGENKCKNVMLIKYA